MFTIMPAQVGTRMRLLSHLFYDINKMLSFFLGLFEVHKLLFSFAMSIKIKEVESTLNHEELDFFIKVFKLANLYYTDNLGIVFSFLL